MPEVTPKHLEGQGKRDDAFSPMEEELSPWSKENPFPGEDDYGRPKRRPSPTRPFRKERS